jgi:peptidyl-prolyl cis-trans isomerase D
MEAPKADFDKTKEELKKRILPKKQDDALAAWIKELKAKAKIEINPAITADK